MKTRAILALTLELAAAALLGGALPSAARAQVSVSVGIQVPLPPNPTFLFAAPGVQVVADSPTEVFYVSGGYWVRREGAWYHATRPGARYVLAEPALVPPALHGLPPGHYRHWQKAQARAAKEAWKAEKAQAKADRKAWKQAQRGHGHGG